MVLEPLPYYDTEAAVLEDEQLIWLTIFSYISIAIFTMQLALATYNCYAFLYVQGKYKTLPLLVFYILTILLTGLRIFYCVFFFANIYNEYLFCMIGMPLTKINMGINQCWMLIELAIRVRLSLKLSNPTENDLDSSQSEQQQQFKTERLIIFGGRAFACLIALNLVVILVYLIIMQFTLEVEERGEILPHWDTAIGYLLYALFVALLVCVLNLIRRLKQMRDVIFHGSPEQRSVFDREICTLWFILGVFNCTYLLRGLWNQLHLAQTNYKKLLMQLVLGLCFDCLPVMVLLVYHFRNFRVKPQKVEKQNKTSGEETTTTTTTSRSGQRTNHDCQSQSSQSVQQKLIQKQSVLNNSTSMTSQEQRRQPKSDEKANEQETPRKMNETPAFFSLDSSINHEESDRIRFLRPNCDTEYEEVDQLQNLRRNTDRVYGSRNSMQMTQFDKIESFVIVQKPQTNATTSPSDNLRPKSGSLSSAMIKSLKSGHQQSDFQTDFGLLNNLKTRRKLSEQFNQPTSTEMGFPAL